MKKKGFTLVELLAVIVILGIILVIAVPNAINYIKNAKNESFYDMAIMFLDKAKTSSLSENNLDYALYDVKTLNDGKEVKSPYGNKADGYVFVDNVKKTSGIILVDLNEKVIIGKSYTDLYFTSFEELNDNKSNMVQKIDDNSLEKIENNIEQLANYVYKKESNILIDDDSIVVSLGLDNYILNNEVYCNSSTGNIEGFYENEVTITIPNLNEQVIVKNVLKDSNTDLTKDIDEYLKKRYISGISLKPYGDKIITYMSSFTKEINVSNGESSNDTEDINKSTISISDFSNLQENVDTEKTIVVEKIDDDKDKENVIYKTDINIFNKYLKSVVSTNDLCTNNKCTDEDAKLIEKFFNTYNIRNAKFVISGIYIDCYTAYCKASINIVDLDNLYKPFYIIKASYKNY